MSGANERTNPQASGQVPYALPYSHSTQCALVVTEEGRSHADIPNLQQTMHCGSAELWIETLALCHLFVHSLPLLNHSFYERYLLCLFAPLGSYICSLTH